MKAEPVTSQARTTRAGANSVVKTSPVVTTKIRVPRRQPGVLSRHRLVNFIHAHMDRKLIVISAPAGYGKTCLLTDFAHETDLAVCWYTLDPFDRDLGIFLEHLITAISLQFAAFGERARALLQSIPDPGRDLYPLVATLVQDIYDTIPEYFVLVLDDYHAVEDQDKIVEFLDLFATYVDENCHIILASRTLPALPNLSLLLARGQAAGLSIDELRFSAQEISVLAQQNYHIALAPEQADRLAERTEGWITGLLLTVAPGWEQAQAGTPGRINLGLYDYLSRQVLDQQPTALRDLLLDSSVLNELDPELCAAVLDLEQPRDFLDQLRARNLFVVEFEGGDSLRYHDLFREFLQATLRRQNDARFTSLTRRAAKAYAARGQWEHAVSRYLTLKDYHEIAGIIEQTATRMYEAGRWDTLAAWIDALPEAILKTRPRCLVPRGKIHMERGEHTLALKAYEQAQEAFGQAGDTLGTAHALLQKSCVLRFQSRYAEALAHCREALDLAGGHTASAQFAQAAAYRNAGLCHLRLGQLHDGLAALQQALRLYDNLEDAYDLGATHHDLGLAYELEGNLARAAEHYQSALLQWQQVGNLGAWANTLNSLGVIHYLRGDYDQAEKTLYEALVQVRQVNNLRIQALIWASLGDLHRDLGAYDLAEQAFRDSLQTATRSNEGFVVTYALDGLGNTLRLRGDRDHARQRLREAWEHAERHDSAYEIGLVHCSLGILDMEQGSQSAREHLDQAIKLFSAGDYRREWARACLYKAQLDYADGKRHKALDTLKQALTLSDQLGFDQFVVVEGRQLDPLLQYAAKQWIQDKAFARLLERIQAHSARSTGQPEPVSQVGHQLPLRIYALGKPRVELDGRAVQWTTAQSRDVFFCLLQHPEGLSKEEIGAIFWPDHSPHKLDGIFRSTLYRLRRTLFRESIVLVTGQYGFNWQANYWFDVQVFEALLDQAKQASSAADKLALLKQATELYTDNYLAGCDGAWCLMDRERLLKRYMDASRTLAALFVEQGELLQAIERYQNILARDHYQEPAHYGLMLCYHRLGDRAAAIRQYQACAGILRDELGVTPSPETSKLFLKIIS